MPLNYLSYFVVVLYIYIYIYIIHVLFLSHTWKRNIQVNGRLTKVKEK